MSDFATKWFSGFNDPDIVKNIIKKKGRGWLRHIDFEQVEGTLDLTVPTAAIITFTDVTMVVSALVAGLVLLTNNNGSGRFFEIDANDAATLTFNSELSESEIDETSNLTDTGAYVCNIISIPRYMGFMANERFNHVKEFADYMDGEVPEGLVTQELIRSSVEALMTVRTLPLNLLEALYGMVDVNPASTEYYHLRAGSESGLENERYYLFFKNQKDKGGFERQVHFFKCKFLPTEELVFMPAVEDFVNVNFSMNVYIEQLCAKNENYYEYRKKKTA